MSQTTFQYYLDQPDIEWTCPACALPQLTDSFFEEVPEGDTLILAEDHQRETTQNTAPKQCLRRDVTQTIFNNDRLELFRKHHNKDFLIAHLNINSIQNEFEELTEVINKINAHIMFVSETKIDASYPNAQFKVLNYSFSRNDRKKGCGGIMALISQSLVRTQLCGEYRTLLESELSYVCNWASLNRDFVVVTGDLNLNRLRPDKPQRKLLLDLEVEQGFECLITKPTRIEKRGINITESLIDVMLTNRPDSFQLSGNFHPCLSDQDLFYGVLKQKINHNKPKVITFRSYKNFDPEHHKQLLSSAPWHVG